MADGNLRSVPTTGLKPAIFVIPDISGFTDFVSSTEIEHSQHIISELLESLIDANSTGLKVSEIEGDAVLFYRFGETDAVDEIREQSRQMFQAFHRNLLRYDRDRICQCGACSAAVDLTLKVVAHAGEAATIYVKDNEKLLGEDVIVAHRLLKNNVPGSEYLLLSGFDRLPEGDWNAESQEDASLGRLEYVYEDLGQYRQGLELPAIEEPDFVPHPNPVVAEIEINAPLDKVYWMVTDYDERVRWTPGLDRIKYDRSHIPRVGTKHVCVINGKDLDVEAIAARRLDGGAVEILERNDGVPVLGDVVSKLMVSGDADRSSVRMEIHPQSPGFFGRLMLKLAHGRIRKNFLASLEQLKEIAEKESLKDQA